MKHYRIILSFLTLCIVLAAGTFDAESTSSLRHRKLVELSNCKADCQALPLMVVFKDACDTTECQAGIMETIGITDYKHLTGLGMIFVNDLTDSQLESLQTREKDVKSIECDSCIVSMADDPICGSDGKSYKNEEELACGLKCRGADSSVSVSYRGKCGSATQSVQGEDDLVPLGNCPTDGSPPKFPLLITFKKDCNVACAAKVMLTANIQESKYTHLVNLNTITLSEDVSDVELAALRRDGKNINTIECDGEVTTEDGSIGIGNGFGIVDETNNVNSELCPPKQPILGGAPQSCDSALTSDCKYSPGPCMLDPNETCYSIRCSCFDGLLQCAQDGSGGGGGNIGIGIVDDEDCQHPKAPCMNEQNYQECIDLKEAGCTSILTLESCPVQFVCDYSQGDGIVEDELVSLYSCPAEGPKFPLIVVFKKGCDVACATNAMQTANIDETKYKHLKKLNMITLSDEVTDVELATLRQAKDIEYIECDSKIIVADEGVSIGIVDGGENKEEVLLENCPKDGSLTLPLLITFQDTCDAACATQTMQKSNIDKTKYDHFTNVNIMSLKEVTSAELTALQGEAKSVKTIECDGVVSVDDTMNGGPVDDTLMDLKSCDDGIRMPLLITFHKKCTADCALAILESNGIDRFEEKAGVYIVNEATENQILALRGKKKEILAIECDNAVGIADDSLMNVDSCKDGIQMPLLVTFVETCGSVCALGTMEGVGINTNQFEILMAGIFKLNEATEGQVLALRGEKKNIAAMECDGMVGIDMIPVDLCNDGSKLPLLVTFKDTCQSKSCMLETMKNANIDETKFDTLGLGSIMLMEVTDDELTALRKSKNISTLECGNAPIVTGEDNLVPDTTTDETSTASSTKMPYAMLLSLWYIFTV